MRNYFRFRRRTALAIGALSLLTVFTIMSALPAIRDSIGEDVANIGFVLVAMAVGGFYSLVYVFSFLPERMLGSVPVEPLAETDHDA